MPHPSQSDRLRTLAHVVANPAENPQASRFAWLILKSARGQHVLQHRLQPQHRAQDHRGDAA